MSHPATHTPTPWTLGVYGEVLSADGEPLLLRGVSLSLDPSTRDEAKANKEFMVRAVNAHADLLAACERIVAKWDAYHADDDSVNFQDYLTHADVEAARTAAIAAAKGQPSTPHAEAR